MNILDIAILVLLAIFVLYGFYRGFTRTALSLASTFLSWLGAFLFYPFLSRFLMSSSFWGQLFGYMSDGAAETLTGFEILSQPASTVTSSQLTDILSTSGLPSSVTTMLRENVLNQAFSGQEGVVTLGQYFNTTLGNLLVNVISFLIIFFALSLIFALIIAMTHAVINLPVLKTLDGVLGGCFGLVQGILLMFVLFAIVPVILSVMPISFVNQYLDNSFFASLFYKSNFILDMLSSII